LLVPAREIHGAPSLSDSPLEFRLRIDRMLLIRGDELLQPVAGPRDRIRIEFVILGFSQSKVVQQIPLVIRHVQRFQLISRDRHLALSNFGLPRLGNTVRMDSVVNQWLDEIRAFVLQGDTDPEVGVRTNRKLRQESKFSEYVDAAHHRWCTDRPEKERSRANAIPCHGTPQYAAPIALIVDLGRPTPDRDMVGVVLQEVDLPLEPISPGDIVGIEKRDELVRREIEAEITCEGYAEIDLVANDSHARVGDRVEDLARLVGRGVIDDQEFEISEALAENAVDCTAEIT